MGKQQILPAKSIKYGPMGNIHRSCSMGAGERATRKAKEEGRHVSAFVQWDRVGLAGWPPSPLHPDSMTKRQVGLFARFIKLLLRSLIPFQETGAERHQFHTICFISITRQGSGGSGATATDAAAVASAPSVESSSMPIEFGSAAE